MVHGRHDVGLKVRASNILSVCAGFYPKGVFVSFSRIIDFNVGPRLCGSGFLNVAPLPLIS